MHYDFIEIGTSDYDTLIESANNNTIGLSIEPIDFYLNNLPSKPLVTKVNCAISNYCGEVDVFYVEPHDIEKHNLGFETRGCNSIGKLHNAHKEYIDRGLSEIVKQKKVEVIDWKELVRRYNIESVNVLKIDAEGHDVVILNNIFDDDEYKVHPKLIFFEAHHLTKESDVEVILNRARLLGYTSRRDKSGYNVILKRKG